MDVHSCPLRTLYGGNNQNQITSELSKLLPTSSIFIQQNKLTQVSSHVLNLVAQLITSGRIRTVRDEIVTPVSIQG